MVIFDMNEPARQLLLRLLRDAHLYGVAEKLAFILSLIKDRKDNKLFLQGFSNFPIPPKALCYDAYAHTNSMKYYESGKVHAEAISKLINKHVNSKSVRVLEWGCGPSRIIRHLDDFLDFDKSELFGSDYNMKSIIWNKNNIDDITFLHNNLEPPLALKENSFDCVYNLSVFTHLSEAMHYAWINELCRVLKPDGIIIFSTHGSNYTNKLLPDERKLFDSGKLVTRGKVVEGKRGFTAFHPESFIKLELLKNFQVLESIKGGSDIPSILQDIWVAKKI